MSESNKNGELIGLGLIGAFAAATVAGMVMFGPSTGVLNFVEGHYSCKSAFLNSGVNFHTQNAAMKSSGTKGFFLTGYDSINNMPFKLSEGEGWACKGPNTGGQYLPLFSR